MLSPEDFDTPRIEEERGGRRGCERLSLSAMEAELKPQVLETFDRIAKTYKSPAQAAGPGSRRERPQLSPAQERRYKKLREEIIEPT